MPSVTEGYQPPNFNYSPQAPAFDTSTPGGLSAVTEYVNRLNRTGQTAANRARIPGSQGLEEQSSRNISQELAGMPDADVIRLLGQQSAEMGASRGMGPAAPATMAGYLQALGLTSYQLKHQGQQDLNAAYGRNPAAPLFDPTSQMLTPYQHENLRLQAAEAEARDRLSQQQLELERERLATQADAAAQRFAGARGGPLGFNSGTGASLTGYGGEYVAPSLGTDILTSRSESENYVPPWASPGYGGPTTTGSGNFYAGGSQGPAAWEDQFWNDWGMSSPVGGGIPTAGTGTTGFEGIPGNDFVSGGFVGSDALPVDIGG